MSAPLTPREGGCRDRADTLSRPYLAFQGITKSFRGVPALADVSFTINRGEIHALLGQNGAGKSTLAKIAAGFYPPSSGKILIDGVSVAFDRPGSAREFGIGMMFQQLSLVSALTVTENLQLMSRRSRHALSECHRSSSLLAASRSSSFAPSRLVSSLSFGERQHLELERLLALGLDVLFLDEPTSSLSPAEAKSFYDLISQLAQDGKTIVLITHRLADALQYADRVTILRHGCYVATLKSEALSRDSLAEMMTGDQPSDARRTPVATSSGRTSSVILAVRALSQVDEETKKNALEHLTFDLFQGEILGLAAVAGNGQRELFQLLSGMSTQSGGTIRFRGDQFHYRLAYPRIAYIPENTTEIGLVPSLSIAENLGIGMLQAGDTLGGILLSRAKLRDRALALIDKFMISGLPDDPVWQLSGGNQRKVLVARELSRQCSLVLAENPTAGLDLRGSAHVLNALRSKADEDGAAVLFYSSDLNDLLAICHRILVLSRGCLVAMRDVAGLTTSELNDLISDGDAGGL